VLGIGAVRQGGGGGGGGTTCQSGRGRLLDSAGLGQPCREG
jgi:hypothetical protein